MGMSDPPADSSGVGGRGGVRSSKQKPLAGLHTAHALFADSIESKDGAVTSRVLMFALSVRLTVRHACCESVCDSQRYACCRSVFGSQIFLCCECV